MTSPLSLSFGILSRILKAETDEESAEICASKPVLQILSIRAISSSSENKDRSTVDRYLVIASDGVNFTQMILYNDLRLYALLKSGQMGKNDIIKVKHLNFVNLKQLKRKAFVLGLFETLAQGSQLGMIGNPLPLVERLRPQPHHALESAAASSANGNSEYTTQQSKPSTTDKDNVSPTPDISDSCYLQPNTAALQHVSPRSASPVTTLKQAVFSDLLAEHPNPPQSVPGLYSSQGDSPLRNNSEPFVQLSDMPNPNDHAYAGQNREITLIKDIDPYKSKWMIKARVAQKSDVKHWKNDRTEGSYFIVIFKDQSGEIEARGFKLTVDVFYEKLQEGRTYYVANAKVQERKPGAYGSANRHSYDLTFEQTTELQECPDDVDIPPSNLMFQSLCEISKLSPGSLCNTIAAIRAVSDVTEFTSKEGKPLTKRELTLVDRSDCPIRLTLWGSFAKNFQVPSSPVVVLRNVKVTEYNRVRNLAMTALSKLDMDSNYEESRILKEWFTNQGHEMHAGNSSSIGLSAPDPSDVYTIQEIKEMDLHDPTIGKNFVTEATVISVDEKFCYPGCRNDACRKKVNKRIDGKWTCENCKEDHEAPKYRYLLQVRLADHTGVAKFQAFGDEGTDMLGRTADELMVLKNCDNYAWQVALDTIKGKTFNVVFNAKEDNYEGRISRKFIITKIKELDYKSGASMLLSQLQDDEEP